MSPTIIHIKKKKNLWGNEINLVQITSTGKKSLDGLNGFDREFYSSAILTNSWVTTRSLLFGALACLCHLRPLSLFFLSTRIIVCWEVAEVFSAAHLCSQFFYPVLDFRLSCSGTVYGSGPLSWERLGGASHLYQNCTLHSAFYSE